MKITSLSRRTDLIFARFSGEVKDCGHYTLIQTKNNPGYHWGNYMVFDHAPAKGDLMRWRELFKKEFTYYDEPHHMVFTWETNPTSPGDYKEFVEAGFEFDEAVVLSTQKVTPPKKRNNQIEIRKVITAEGWEDAIQLQIACSNPKYMNSSYESFKREQMGQYRKMSEAGLGYWFVAYVGNKPAADLGIFFENKLGRYQNVGTHPDYRRQGICQTLVYETAQIAFNEFKVDTLVMEADANYHAAKIYESVGFTPTEKNYALSWWKKD
jgi:ribosomal protein S18 acetylase RimI-like enzyme